MRWRSSTKLRELFDLVGDLHGQTKVLIQQAATHGYSGRSERAIELLSEAEKSLENHGDPVLAFAVYCNLANDYLKLRDYESASTAAGKCRRLPSDAMGALKLLWIDGRIKEGIGELSAAESLLAEARTEYQQADDSVSFAIISVHLAAVLTEQERWAQAVDLLLQAIPTLRSLELRHETVSAISLLAKAIETKLAPQDSLQRLRAAIETDPLVALNVRSGMHVAPRPSREERA